ncbi:hypothetical protein DAI22_03g130500 [Oryza sativa Japonica Group]|nr:hypothetical protein DAI22_03g130500 [Oryza sativa Japonica Group]
MPSTPTPSPHLTASSYPRQSPAPPQGHLIASPSRAPIPGTPAPSRCCAAAPPHRRLNPRLHGSQRGTLPRGRHGWYCTTRSAARGSPPCTPGWPDRERTKQHVG